MWVKMFLGRFEEEGPSLPVCGTILWGWSLGLNKNWKKGEEVKYQLSSLLLDSGYRLSHYPHNVVSANRETKINPSFLKLLLPSIFVMAQTKASTMLNDSL